MRKLAYDELCREALVRLEAIPATEMTKEEEGIRDALNVVLAETDDVKLEGYYARIDEFYTVNVGRGLEYLNGGYLLNGVIA